MTKQSTNCWRTNSERVPLSLLALLMLISAGHYFGFAFDILSAPPILAHHINIFPTAIKSRTSKTPSSSSLHYLQLQSQTTGRSVIARRPLLSNCKQAATLSFFAALLLPSFPPAATADFAPGGTLLDREVSITYGNLEASPSRSRDNSNVLFPQDNFYKFGAAARWILPPGSTDYPLTIPFVPSQRRYDALKKYGPKVKKSVDAIVRIGSSSSTLNVPERTDPSYQLRSLGLIADSFLASDNTGTTNELMLARWYINEMYLRIGDYRDSLVRGDAIEAKACYDYLTKAMNSYLSLLNRSITSKVGEQFGYII